MFFINKVKLGFRALTCDQQKIIITLYHFFYTTCADILNIFTRQHKVIFLLLKINTEITHKKAPYIILF